MFALKRPVGIALLSATLVAVTALSAAAAPTSTTPKKWSIEKGGAVVATSKSFTVTDVTQKAGLTCGSAVVKAKLKSGHRLLGANAGTVTAATVTKCSFESIAVTITSGHLPWHLNLVSYNSKTGVTTATVTGIHLKMGVSLIGCSAIVDGTGAAANNGSIQVTYTNKTGKLTVLKTGGKLKLYSVKSCDGIVKTGDTIAISATYLVTPKQTITSP